jgi:putative flavoprotein involved in K+ transport
MVQPRRIFGVDSMTWMDRLGFLWVPPHTLRGRIAARSMAFPGREYSDRQLRRAGVRLVGAAVQAHDRSIGFRCGAQCTFDNVIWATGYRTDDRWIEVPGATADGLAIHERGISAVQGLFFIGREYQTCRASSLLCGVGRDAAFIAEGALSFLWSKTLGTLPAVPASADSCCDPLVPHWRAGGWRETS